MRDPLTHIRNPNAPSWGIISLALILVSTISGCGDGFPVGVEETRSAAEDLGFDTQRFFFALDVARASGSIQGLVVDRNGTVVGEAYGEGISPWTLFETWSLTGSVTSLLVGAALEEGSLESLDLTLGELLIPWDQTLTEAQRGITIRQLLTMTSGVSRPTGSPEEYFAWLEADDQVEWVLSHPLRSHPGERYYLDSAAAHLLSAALLQATGKNLSELAEGAVLEPLGVPQADWMSDSNGIDFGGFGLRLRTRDLRKFARLILNDGVWEGQDVLPTSWIRESTQPQIHPYPDYPHWGFGYLWKSSLCSGHPCIYSSGYGGQILVAVPDLDLAIALNSSFSDDPDEADSHADIAWDLVLNHIIPSAEGG